MKIINFPRKFYDSIFLQKLHILLGTWITMLWTWIPVNRSDYVQITFNYVQVAQILRNNYVKFQGLFELFWVLSKIFKNLGNPTKIVSKVREPNKKFWFWMDLGCCTCLLTIPFTGSAWFDPCCIWDQWWCAIEKEGRIAWLHVLSNVALGGTDLFKELQYKWCMHMQITGSIYIFDSVCSHLVHNRGLLRFSCPKYVPGFLCDFSPWSWMELPDFTGWH